MSKSPSNSNDEFNEEYESKIPKKILDKIEKKDFNIKKVFNSALDSCKRVDGDTSNMILFEKDPVELINNICAYTNKVFKDNDFVIK